MKVAWDGLGYFEKKAKKSTAFRTPIGNVFLLLKWGEHLSPWKEECLKVATVTKKAHAFFAWPVAIVVAGRFCRYLDKVSRGVYTSDVLFRKTLTKTGDLVEKTSQAILWTDKIYFNALLEGAKKQLSIAVCLGASIAASVRLFVAMGRLIDAYEQRESGEEVDLRPLVLNVMKHACTCLLSGLAIVALLQGHVMMPWPFLALCIQTTLVSIGSLKSVIKT